MDKFDKILMGFVTILIAAMIFILGWLLSEQNWKHYAIIHHSAFYEPDSWGNVKFHWNDDSFAQTPFQDEAWSKIQQNLFQQKLNSLGLK
jgi:hypothetical protein